MKKEPVIPMVRCWCAPPGLMFFMEDNPCTWPECINSERPDPNADE